MSPDMKPAVPAESAVPRSADSIVTAADADVASGPAVDAFDDIAELSYEQARDELAAIVGGLESGQVPLEESMASWRRGEALAAHCTAWLDGAQRQIAEATGTERA